MIPMTFKERKEYILESELGKPIVELFGKSGVVSLLAVHEAEHNYYS